MEFVAHDIVATGAISIVSATALLVLVLESLFDRSEGMTVWISFVGLVAAGLVAFNGISSKGLAYAGMVSTGGYADFWGMAFCGTGALSVMLSRSYLKRCGLAMGEHYCLLLLSIVGMMLMASAADLIILFLGLELMSISFYTLTGFARGGVMGNEASLKYFLLGAFATGFLLYGIALLYGSTGSMNIGFLVEHASSSSGDIIFLIGLALLLVGLVFKVAAVPFHMWVPDVYEGAPTTVTGLMSTGGKAAAFSGLLLVFAPKLLSDLDSVRDILALIAALSMIVGNVLAIAQNSVKRMLAYSSIAHAGYIITGIVGANAQGSQGVLFYLVAYALVNVGAFGVLSVLEKAGQNTIFDDCTGLARSHPFLAGLMALFMFSLTGIPPLAGFFGKYLVFSGAVKAGYTWLVVVGVLTTVVSAFYYLRLVVLMYFRDREPVTETSLPATSLAALLFSAFLLVVAGIFPDLILDLTTKCF
jgi:NADH-quinone oxidoreductase subunit N